MELAEAINKALNTATPKQEFISKLKQAPKDFKLKISGHSQWDNALHAREQYQPQQTREVLAS
jgi:hypothetical protein